MHRNSPRLARGCVSLLQYSKPRCLSCKIQCNIQETADSSIERVAWFAGCTELVAYIGAIDINCLG